MTSEQKPAPTPAPVVVEPEIKFEKSMSAEQLSIIMNMDKQILRRIGTVCFRRCILSFDRELLTAAENNCVDRCTNKFN